jgi:DNA-binding NarL/FixJ family response regulator
LKTKELSLGNYCSEIIDCMNITEIRILIADDHQIFIEGVKAVLQKYTELKCVIAGEANTGNSLLKMADQVEAEILLLDLNLPDMDGLEVLSKLKEKACNLRVIIFSIYDEPKIVKAAFKAGADAYVLKGSNFRELYEAIEAVRTGQTYISIGLSLTNGSGMNSRFLQHGKLSVSFEDRFIKKFSLTKRELEVLKLVGKAMTNKEIAKELYISDQTVSVHRKNIMRKLGVSSTAGLIKMAFENNLL